MTPSEGHFDVDSDFGAGDIGILPAAGAVTTDSPLQKADGTLPLSLGVRLSSIGQRSVARSLNRGAQATKKEFARVRSMGRNKESSLLL